MDVKSNYLNGVCFFCLAATREAWCNNCEKDFIQKNARCPVCARRTFNGKTCGNCIKQPPHFLRTEVLFDYEYPANELIKTFKFNDQPALSRHFADKFAEKLFGADKPPETLIPVPLHKTRQQSRGYNQSLELAKNISRRLNILLDATLCKRIINTDPQSTLSTKARSKNVKNAFILTESCRSKHVVIIDDVITTGSTVNEIAKLLKQSGCERVDVWAIART